jgi:calcineurin-like phosphoesterase
MDNLQTNPFIEFEKLLNNVEKSDIHIVDFHCETTSEKNAFLKSFAGKLTAILCTHTHVQTADERIINGTGYITDVGMTGGRDGVIGADSTSIVDMFFEKIERFKLASAKSKYQFNAVILSIDNKSNELKKIERLFINEN